MTLENLNTILMDRERFPLHWQMSGTEQLALIALLEKRRPHLTLEVGTYEGGSLQVLSKLSERVVSLDINPTVPDKLGHLFGNVEFVVGDSAVLLPDLVREWNVSGETPEFILIDGNHAADAVRRDIQSVLRIRPSTECLILMHDSFNPDCRRGILSAPWETSNHVHSVEIDFVLGNVAPQDGDTALAGSMWGGFACAILQPEPRTRPLAVKETYRHMFEAVLPISSHHTVGDSSRGHSQFAMSFVQHLRSLSIRIKKILKARRAFR